MNITVHRGAHEIGGSCVEVRNKKSRIVIDIGMPLVTENGERVESRKIRDSDHFLNSLPHRPCGSVAILDSSRAGNRRITFFH